MVAIFSLECSPESLWEALLQKVFRFRDKEFKKIITTTYQRRHLGSYNAQQLRGMHDSYLMSRHWLKDLFCCLMSEHQWNFRLIKFKKKKNQNIQQNCPWCRQQFFHRVSSLTFEHHLTWEEWNSGLLGGHISSCQWTQAFSPHQKVDRMQWSSVWVAPQTFSGPIIPVNIN